MLYPFSQYKNERYVEKLLLLVTTLLFLIIVMNIEST